jgi:hypothetical protein
MISDFLVQHPSGPFFSLSKTEYERALVKYPQVSHSPSVLVHVPIHKLSFSSRHVSASK